MKERILVTGANGYIGRHVVERLVKENVDVIAADFSCDKITQDVAMKVETSIFEDNNLIEKIGHVDRCIHLAWRDGFVHNSIAHMEDLSKHFNLIGLLCKEQVKSISVMGTMHEIGYWEGAIDETTPTNPQSMYGIAKNALRLSSKLLTQNADVQLKWLRAYYIVGDDKKSNSIFGKILQKAEQGEKEFPFTTGKNLYDFIDVKELANQIVCATIQDEINGEINCCSGNPISLKDKVEQFIKDNGLDIKLVYGAYPDRKYDSPGIWGDNGKIRKIMQNTK